MRLTSSFRLAPAQGRVRVDVPDVTPSVVLKHISGDDQAVLTRVRYNRLLDLFLGVTAFPLQTKLSSFVPDIGTVETGELYFGVSNSGTEFIIPVQAKGGTERFGSLQAQFDLAMCNYNFAKLRPRPVAVELVHDFEGEVIVMFELQLRGDQILVVDERHYRLVAADAISSEDLRSMEVSDSR